MDMLRKAEKNERDGRNAGAPEKKQTDKEKQRNPKKSSESPERKEPRKARPVGEATSQNPRRAVKDAPAPKKHRKESPDATEFKGRKLSESGS
jgi:hypothetical protein